MDKLMQWQINLTSLTNEEKAAVAEHLDDDASHETVAQRIADITGRHVILAERVGARNKIYSRIRVFSYDDYDPAYNAREMEIKSPFEIAKQWNC